MVKDTTTTLARPSNSPSDVGDHVQEETPAPMGPSRLAMVEERLLRLQAEFTQLAPDLLSATTGLYELKGSVGRLKRRLRARQARHRAQFLQDYGPVADRPLPYILEARHYDHVNACSANGRSV